MTHMLPTAATLVSTSSSSSPPPVLSQNSIADDTSPPRRNNNGHQQGGGGVTLHRNAPDFVPRGMAMAMGGKVRGVDGDDTRMFEQVAGAGYNNHRGMTSSSYGMGFDGMMMSSAADKQGDDRHVFDQYGRGDTFSMHMEQQRGGAGIGNGIDFRTGSGMLMMTSDYGGGIDQQRHFGTNTPPHRSSSADFAPAEFRAAMAAVGNNGNNGRSTNYNNTNTNNNRMFSPLMNPPSHHHIPNMYNQDLIPVIATLSNTSATPIEIERAAEVLVAKMGGYRFSKQEYPNIARVTPVAQHALVTCLMRCLFEQKIGPTVALLRVLVISSRVSELKPSLMHAGAGNALIQAILMFPISEEVAHEASWALWNIAEHDETPAQLYSLGASRACIQVLTTHLQFASTVHKALGALRFLCLPANIQFLMSQGAGDACINATRVHGVKNVGVANQGLATLANLADCVEHRLDLSRKGAGRVALEAMRAHHRKDADVSFQGVRFYQLFTTDCEENQLELVMIGAHMQICEALKVHGDKRNLGLIKYGLGAIWHMSMPADQQTRGALVAAGAPEVVSSILRRFAAIKPVIGETACGTIWNLALCNPDAQHLFVEDHRVAGIIYDEMLARGKHPATALLTCRASWALAYKATPMIKNALLQSGIPNMVLSFVTRIHVNDPAICKNAATLLGNLAHDSPSRSLLMEMGMAEAMVQCLSLHYSTDADLCEQVILALANLGGMERAYQDHVVLRVGAIPIILQACHTHLHHPRVAMATCMAVFNLTVGNPPTQNVTRQAGAVHVMVDAWKEHGVNEGVVEQGLRAVCTLSGNDGGGGSGSGDFALPLAVMAEAMESFPHNILIASTVLELVVKKNEGDITPAVLVAIQHVVQALAMEDVTVVEKAIPLLQRHDALQPVCKDVVNALQVWGQANHVSGVQTCMSAMRTMVTCQDRGVRAVMVDATAMIADMVTRFGNVSAPVVADGMSILSTLILSDVDPVVPRMGATQVQLVLHGAAMMDTGMSLLKRWRRENEQVTSACMLLFRSMSTFPSNHGSNSNNNINNNNGVADTEGLIVQQIRTRFCRQGAVEEILLLLANAKPLVIDHALGCMWALAAPPGIDTTVSSNIAFIVDSTVDKLKKFGDMHAGIAYNGCGLLGAVASSSRYFSPAASSFVDSSAGEKCISAVLEVMSRHPNNTSVVNQGAIVIQRLITVNPQDNFQYAISLGAPRILVTPLQAQLQMVGDMEQRMAARVVAAPVYEAVLAALWVVSNKGLGHDDGEAVVRCAAMCLKDAVMWKHLSVAEKACGVISEVLQHEVEEKQATMLKSLLVADDLETHLDVVKSLELFKDRRVLKTACHLLRELCKDRDEFLKVGLVKSGVVEEVFAALVWVSGDGSSNNNNSVGATHATNGLNSSKWSSSVGGEGRNQEENEPAMEMEVWKSILNLGI